MRNEKSKSVSTPVSKELIAILNSTVLGSLILWGWENKDKLIGYVSDVTGRFYHLFVALFIIALLIGIEYFARRVGRHLYWLIISVTVIAFAALSFTPLSSKNVIEMLLEQKCDQVTIIGEGEYVTTTEYLTSTTSNTSHESSKELIFVLRDLKDGVYHYDVYKTVTLQVTDGKAGCMK